MINQIHNKMRKKILSFFALAIALSTSVLGQDSKPQFSFGIAGGGHFGGMSFSELNKNLYPKSNMETSGLFSVFAEVDFLKNGLLGIRPQLSFLNRGGKLHAALDATSPYEDITYKLHAHYVDFRLPILVQFGTYKSVVRPYLFVAPVLGFATGGDISYEYTYPRSMAYNGYRVPLTKGNMQGVEFAAQVGAGVKFAVPVAADRCYLGVEFAYEKGLTDTYGTKEKNHEAVNTLPSPYRLKGARRLDGFEVQATLTVPFSVFKKKTAPAPERVVVERVVEAPKPKRKPCYTLDEIARMISAGESVHGMKICAISDIKFDLGKSTIKRESHGYLDKLASVLIAQNKHVVISGHTDNSGTDKINEKLSKDRADAVASYLIKKGLDASLVTTAGFGDTQPIADNETTEGRAQNRRVEIDLE